MTGTERLAALLSLAGLLLAGCAVAGPTTVRNGRAAYNEAIVATNNEQLLAMIVRIRYQEPSGLLAVASVTANVRVQANVGFQAGFGPSNSYAGNLVPLSAGALYEENPTISYTPAQGENYLKQFLSPLPLEFAVLLLSSLGDSPLPMMLLVKGINDIRNPDFLTEESSTPDSRFREIAELLAALHRRGALTWSQESSDPPAFALVLRGTSDEYEREVERLHELLGIPKPRSLDELITLRVFLGVGAPPENAVELRTRSVYDLFRIAAASVDVPPEHTDSGLAPPMPPAGPAASEIRIHRSASRPPLALVAVNHHGWWYSILGTDGRSKETFRVIEAIMTARIADSVDTTATPLLTVPVSR